jgi:hypothetical protein
MKRLDVLLGSVLFLEIAIAALAAAPGRPNLPEFTNGLGLLLVLGLLALIKRRHRWPWVILLVLTLLSMTEFLASGYTVKGFTLLALSFAELAALLSNPIRSHVWAPRDGLSDRPLTANS